MIATPKHLKGMFELSKIVEKINPFDTTSDSKENRIEFICPEDIYEQIPEPIPANKSLPSWYTQLEMEVENEDNVSIESVRKCSPFFDALTLGWIIPLCGDVNFAYDENDDVYEVGGEIEADNSSFTLAAKHDREQVGGGSHPIGDKPIFKFNNPWAIKVPEGYSLLVVPPLNRTESRFQTFSGVVDADKYLNNINFPVVWKGGEYDGVVKKGTPLAQVIPIKRSELFGDGEIHTISDKEHKYSKKISEIRKNMKDQNNFYWNNLWVPKDGSRIVKRPQNKDSTESSSNRCPFH